jgi:hypothetical protein
VLICPFIFDFQAMSEATFWFTTVVTVIILMIPVLAWRFYFVDVCPTLSDRVRLKQRLALLRYDESLLISVIHLVAGWVGSGQRKRFPSPILLYLILYCSILLTSLTGECHGFNPLICERFL